MTDRASVDRWRSDAVSPADVTLIVRRFVQPFLIIGLTLFGEMVVSAEPASVASIEPGDLVEYEDSPERIKKMIDLALDLTKMKLAYTFGSNSPAKKGMDCSGTIQRTLLDAGVEGVPRSSFTIYNWAKDEGNLTSVRGEVSLDDPVFDDLKPGDLLFWEGTYETAKRDPPISHVMLFLGTLKEDGKGVVFGASSGRRYRGKKIHGVSVFDWRLPSASSKSKFVAYGPVPGLEGEGDD